MLSLQSRQQTSEIMVLHTHPLSISAIDFGDAYANHSKYKSYNCTQSDLIRGYTTMQWLILYAQYWGILFCT